MRMVPMNFSAKESSQTLSGISQKMPPWDAPAQLIRMSMRPKTSLAFAATVSADAGSVRSLGTTTTSA